LKNLKLKYFHFDKKSSFIEIIKTIFENLLFEEIISNNDNQNYLNSLIEISKGNFETNNDRIKLLLDLYKEENYKTIDEFVLKL
jgi:CRISPR/Cas system-associated protein Csx1